jgi:hypothetical protein
MSTVTCEAQRAVEIGARIAYSDAHMFLPSFTDPAASRYDSSAAQAFD